MPKIKLFYHITWSTKYRDLLIDFQVREILYKSIVKKSAELGSTVLALNGVEDHIHLLVSSSPKTAPSILIGQIKGASSHLIRRLGWKEFRWQKEYFIRAVTEEELPKVIGYIENQQSHHPGERKRRKNFPL
jgi:putative transposase